MIGGKKQELGKSNQSHWIMGTPFKSIPSLAVLPSSLGGGKMAFYRNPTSKADRAIAGGELMCVWSSTERLRQMLDGDSDQTLPRARQSAPSEEMCRGSALHLQRVDGTLLPPFHLSNSNFNWKEVGSMTEER